MQNWSQLGEDYQWGCTSLLQLRIYIVDNKDGQHHSFTIPIYQAQVWCLGHRSTLLSSWCTNKMHPAGRARLEHKKNMLPNILPASICIKGTELCSLLAKVPQSWSDLWITGRGKGEKNIWKQCKYKDFFHSISKPPNSRYLSINFSVGKTYSVIEDKQDHCLSLEPCLQLIEDWNRAIKHCFAQENYIYWSSHQSFP